MKQPRDYQFGAIVLGITFLILAMTFGFIYQSYAEAHSGYYVDVAPDGWYQQREGISPSQIVDRQLFLPICDHAYLGPLHGYWNLSGNVNITVSGWYNLRILNNTIVEVYLRSKSDGSW